MFSIKLAGLVIGIENRYSYVFDISRDYLSEEKPQFILSASDVDIETERALAETDFPVGVLESTAIYRKIADKVCEYDAFVFHGAVIELDGKAYLFTAKSGVGKTTHIKLWLSLFGKRAKILNGDKPIIRIVDGKTYVSGTPWRGKEGYGMSGTALLSGIAFLERAAENTAYPVKSDDVLVKFATQAYIPRTTAASGARVLSLFDSVLRSVPLITLKCNMETEAAEIAYSAFLEAAKINNAIQNKV